MTRNEIIFYVGIAIVVIASEYGTVCLGSPLLIILMIISVYVFPINE